MPPRKTKLSKEQLKRLVDDYSINFEGPVPPKQWPAQYSHLFQVVRDIWANRYDEYIKRTDIDQKTVRNQKSRVRDLRTKASSLRTDFGINEDTWRGLIETPVMARFDQEIVWSDILIFLRLFQAHSLLVFVVEMRTGSRNTKHNPETRMIRRNWKRNERTDARAPAMMATIPVEI